MAEASIALGMGIVFTIMTVGTFVLMAAGWEETRGAHFHTGQKASAEKR